MTAKFSFGDVRYSALNHATPRNKKLFAIFGGLCFLIALSLVHVSLRASPYNSDGSSKNSTPPANCPIIQNELAEKRKTRGENWIVVTTINQPTDAMNLLCHLEGWNVVVVADTKSPKDWTCGSCVYLSVEDQQCLSYGIVDLIPYRAYTRKNIGYLWAIQQGATKVFDTDDDNLPTGKDIIFESPTGGVVGYRTDKAADTGKSVNIYSHFGRPDIWPRGFPLKEIDIRRPVDYIPALESLSEKQKELLAPPMMIQQGLADLDPDVDAIFRLTQVQELKKAKFCKKSPSIRLSPGTFCPFNSQNTLFSYDAFWGLVLPITVSFRVCDIWRGYWVQRLLWDVNGSLGFTKPTVDQIRNAHNYLDDYRDELQIYEQTSKFIDFLSTWNSNSAELEDRIVELMEAMAINEFIGEDDVDLAKRWVKDLKSVGYAFPKVSSYNSDLVHTTLSQVNVLNRKTQISRKLSNDALAQCRLDAKDDPTMSRIQITPAPASIPSEKFKNVLLVVNFNHPKSYNAIEPFLSIYGPYFPNVKFYGPQVPAEFKDKVTEVEGYDGGFTTSYRGLVKAMETYPEYEGYMYTNDDTVLNVFQLLNLDLNKVWKQVPNLEIDLHDRSKPEPFAWWWHLESATNMWNDPTSLTAKQLDRIHSFTKVNGPADIRSYCDAVYIPKRIAVELTEVLNRFAKHSVFLEMAVGLALVAIEPTENWESWKETYLWFDPSERPFWRNYLKEGISMLHPVKLTEDPKATEEIAKELAHWIETVPIV